MTTFLKLHHGFLEHEKHADLSREALLLHISGLMYASRELTDGRLPKGIAPRSVWAAWLTGCDIEALAGELIDAGVWEDWPNHYSIVNYTDYNRTKEQVDHEKALRAGRNRRYNSKRIEEQPSTDTDTDYRGDASRDASRDASYEFPVDVLPIATARANARSAIRGVS
jgi:hypothetical protein